MSGDEPDYLDGWLRRRIQRQVEEKLPRLVADEIARRAREAAQLITEGVCVCQTCGTALYEHRNGPARQTRVADVIQLVSQDYGIRADLILSRAQTRDVTIPRQAIMWLARDIGIPVMAIGRFLKRDHTTVIAGARRVEDLIRRGGDEADRVLHLRSLLKPAVAAAAREERAMR